MNNSPVGFVFVGKGKDFLRRMEVFSPNLMRDYS